MCSCDCEMPKYKCIKEVHALQIKEIALSLGGKAMITPANEGYASFEVDAEYVSKHSPQPGGYYVVYADGYKSWSPKEAFEEGYVLVE